MKNSKIATEQPPRPVLEPARYWCQVELPWMPPYQLRGNSVLPWQARIRFIDDMKEKGALIFLKLQEESQSQDLKHWHGTTFPAPHVRVTFEFIKPKRGDLNNFVIGMKYFIDGMVKKGLVKDDDPEYFSEGAHTIRRPTTEEKAEGKKERIIMTVEVL